MKDYGTTVKGGVDTWTVVLVNSSGWDAGVTSWTWKMLLGAQATPTTLALALTASNRVLSTDEVANDTLTLTFAITASQSDGLAAGKYLVEIEGAEAGGTEHYYPAMAGNLVVRAPYGGG